MSSLLPIRSDPSPGGQEPRVVDLDGEDADEVFSALSSSTARRIVTVLHEEPRTQSDIAEALDTSVQNVRYHLDKLEDAGLVEVVDTWYSSRGNEMSVYAPADGALIVSGDEGTASRLKSALSRLVGGTAVVGAASLLVQALARRFGGPGGTSAGTGDPGGDSAPGGGAAPAGGNATGGDGAGFAANDSVEGSLQGGGDEAPRTAAEAVETTRGGPAVSDPETTAPAVRDGETPTATVTDGGVDLANATTERAGDAATTAADAVDPAAGAAGGLEPGLAFFLGGVTVLAAVVTVWYFSGR